MLTTCYISESCSIVSNRVQSCSILLSEIIVNTNSFIIKYRWEMHSQDTIAWFTWITTYQFELYIIYTHTYIYIYLYDPTQSMSLLRLMYIYIYTREQKTWARILMQEKKIWGLLPALKEYYWLMFILIINCIISYYNL